MGPRFNGVEDLDDVVLPFAIRMRASMGPRFNGVEDPQPTNAKNTGTRASMGPRFNGVEDPQRWGTS